MQLKNFYPHLIAIFILLVLSLRYSLPLVDGKTLNQNDVIQSKGASKELQDYHDKTGEYPLWTNSMFSGMPTYQVYLDYPMSLTVHVGRFLAYQVLPEPVNIVFIYLLGFYLMAVMLGYNPWLALLGAVGFAFSSYNIISIEAGHISKALAIGFAPPLIGAVILTYRGKYWVGGSLAAFFASIELYTNHLQITYYVVLALGVYAVFALIYAIQENKIKEFALASVILAFAGVLSLGSQTSRLWTTYEYSQETIRGKSELTSNTQSTGGLDRDYAFQWSYGISETMTFIIPNFYGGGAAETLDDNSNTYKVLVDRGVPQRDALNFTQNLSGYLYWGNQPFTSGPAYVGIVICFLFMFSLGISKNRIKWYILTATVLLTSIAWGKNFFLNNFFFDYLPLFNKFRAVTMTLSLVQIFMVWMILLGMEEVLNYVKELKNKPKVVPVTKTKKGKKQPVKAKKAQPKDSFLLRPLLYTTAIFGAITLLYAGLGGSILSFKTADMVDKGTGSQVVTTNKDEQLQTQLVGVTQNESFAQDIVTAIRDDRSSKMKSDAFRGFVLVLLTAGFLFVFIRQSFEFPPAGFYVGMVLLILIDIWWVSFRYLNNDDFVTKRNSERVLSPSTADQQILQDKDPHYRVLNMSVSTFNDATTSYFHKSIGGYHGAKFRRYQELFENQIQPELGQLGQLLGANQGKLKFKPSDSLNLNMLSMLNTKYVIIPGQQGDLQALENESVFGNAWFVEEIKWVKNADEEMEALGAINPLKTVLVDERYREEVGEGLGKNPDKNAKIKLTSYSPDELTYESDSKTKQAAIFSEIYYNQGKGWQAYIDGKEVPHFRANYVLRGLVIPAGKHKVEFKFEPKAYDLGETIALISSLLIFGGLGFAGFLAFKVQDGQETKETVD